MANESTAIHDLLAGLQRKAVPDDPTDDVLFSGSRREDDFGGARVRHARGTEPPPNLFAMPAPPPPEVLPSPHLVVALPRPFQHMPAAGIDPNLQTVRVSKNPAGHWSSNKKIYAIPVGLGVVAAILLGMYVGGGSSKPAPVTSAAIVEDEKPSAVETAPAPAVAPVVMPVAEPAAPTVTPIESAPAPAAAVAAAPVVAAELPRDAVAPPAVVPESAFVAKHEPTVATVPAPAAAASPEETAAAEETVAPAPKIKKAKRAAKRAATKRAKREGKKVARVERAEKNVDPAASTDAKLGGNGALSISSAEPREVWVDGRNSKRMTPLRVLLKPGKHKVTLFNKEAGKAKTFEVEIKANETTKVSK